MKKYIISIASLVASILCLVIISCINHEISIAYKLAVGKTKALFGLTELTYTYKYYFLAIGIISLTLALIAKKRKENKTLTRVTIYMSLIAIVIVFIPIWRLMI
ncbi:hypothetical protein [Williamwhitmania taraxaci]|uniref:Lipoprotein n=1 Tax=Williamwhitmania taraxaci TaxID=1640674 RepID=A0A1G6HST2_9BACT|nr:hypothetical protein [Williamwhitmania taraxaci]SDB97208.1 hypothetical protein SAMN05216323_10135 [Williamwhitmania taraxaci]